MTAVSAAHQRASKQRSKVTYNRT